MITSLILIALVGLYLAIGVGWVHFVFSGPRRALLFQASDLRLALSVLLWPLVIVVWPIWALARKKVEKPDIPFTVKNSGVRAVAPPRDDQYQNWPSPPGFE